MEITLVPILLLGLALGVVTHPKIYTPLAGVEPVRVPKRSPRRSRSYHVTYYVHYYEVQNAVSAARRHPTSR